MKKVLTWAVFVISTWIFYIYLYRSDPSTPFQAFFTACTCGAATSLIVPCIYQIKWRYDNGVDLLATLETDPEKVKAHMLHIMQWGHEHGMVGALKEFNDIFRNYPQWDLSDWEVFRAWYKHEIDHMTQRPEIYHLTMKVDGSPYSKEADPLYDPDAPDWELFDRDRSHDFDDDDFDEEDDGYDDYGEKRESGSSAGDAFAIGIGIGAGSALCNGGDSSGDDVFVV